jgi:purine-nucleoside phosphorylase
MRKKAREAFRYIKKQTALKPEIGVILGTGLAQFVQAISITKTIPYKEIPHFPEATVECHPGKFIMGRINKRRIIAMQGRFHYYEGYSAREIALPVTVMKMLGIKTLIISNAAGGLNPNFASGDIMIIIDHINLLPDNPLRGQNDQNLGSRFPDMCNCYNHRLIEITEKVALENKIPVQKGVYVGVSGPNLETRAEYRFLRIIGADAVGMSTVPEVIMARHLNIKVLGISIITDMGIADALEPTSVDKIVKTAKKAEPKLTKLVSGVVKVL